MPTIRRVIPTASLAILACLALTGCDTLSGLGWFGGGKRQQQVIHVQEVSTPTGRPVLIYTRVLLSSVNIKDAKIATVKGGDELELTLDLSGSHLWMELRRDLAGEELAVVVDGWCRCIVQVAPPAPSENPALVYLPGPWGAKELREIVRQAPINYELMHQH